jgi:hypothetical protein
MLTYLLIAFIVLVALAPLSHFRPSKRQRLLANMREHAALNGMFVEFRQLPGQPGGRDLRTGDVIYYGKRLPSSVVETQPASTWICDHGKWRNSDRHGQPPPEVLKPLGDLALVAAIAQGSCGIYWVESTQEEDAQLICQVVQQWSEVLSGAASAPG